MRKIQRMFTKLITNTIHETDNAIEMCYGNGDTNSNNMQINKQHQALTFSMSRASSKAMRN